MTVEYFPEHDMLTITLARTPYEDAGATEVQPGIVLHFDREGRLAEIEIEEASRRVDLNELRRRYSFEEIVPAEA